jgi:hypothetical protein
LALFTLAAAVAGQIVAVLAVLAAMVAVELVTQTALHRAALALQIEAVAVVVHIKLVVLAALVWSSSVTLVVNEALVALLRLISACRFRKISKS